MRDECAFTNLLQLPHTRKSIAQKGQKEQYALRLICMAVSDRQFSVFKLIDFPTESKALQPLLNSRNVRNKRLKLPNVKYE